MWGKAGGFPALGPVSGEPGKRSGVQKFGYVAGVLIGLGIAIVVLGTLAWMGAFVFNQLMTQVG
jgi:hypothetical protein